MPKAFALCVAIALAAGVCAPQSQAETVFARGMRLYNARQYRAAATAFQTAAQQDSGNAWIPYYLGNALMQLGDVPAARRQYERGYELGPATILGVYCRRALDSIKPRPVAMINPPASQSRPYGTFSRSRSPAAAGEHHDHNHDNSGQYARMMGPKPRLISHGEAGNHGSDMIGMESHSEGVATLPQRPETDLVEQWRRWFIIFRHTCESQMAKIIFTRPGWQTMNGGTELYCSVDRNHKLRARIHETHADDVFNTAILDVIRMVDGSTALSLPPGSNIDGFNFYFDWDARAIRQLGDMGNLRDVHGDLRQNVTGLNATPNSLTGSGSSRDVSGALRNRGTNAALRNNNTGLTANQGSLKGSPSSSDVNAELINAEVAGKIVHGGKADELHATQLRLPGMENVFGEPLGSIKTEVTGLVMPPDQADATGKLKPGEKGQAGVAGQLKVPDAQTEVTGQIMPGGDGELSGKVKPAAKGKSGVAGQLNLPDAQTEVTGELKTPSAKTEVTGEVKPPSANTEVTGEVKPPSANTEVSGEVKTPSANTEVSGEVKIPSANTEVSGEVKPPAKPEGSNEANSASGRGGAMHRP